MKVPLQFYQRSSDTTWVVKIPTRSSLYFQLNSLCAPLSKHSFLYLLFFAVFKTFLRVAVQHTFPDIKTPNVTLSLILEGKLLVTKMK